jgi:hypothetical protein
MGNFKKNFPQIQNDEIETLRQEKYLRKEILKTN